jgi:hypothetical protein
MTIHGKGVIALLAGLGLLIGMLSMGWAGQASAELHCDGKSLSAHLENVPLKHVLESLKKERGIWFQGEASILDEQVTVQFTKLPLKTGLERVLASLNYSLVFNREGTILGVIVTGKKTLSPQSGRIKLRSGRAMEPSPRRAERPASFAMEKNAAPPGLLLSDSEEIPEELKVIEKVPAPGGDVEMTREERENFKIIKGSPPPEDPSIPVTQDLESLDVVKDCPPPEM